MIGATGPYIEILFWALFTLIVNPILLARLLYKMNAVPRWLQKLRGLKIIMSIIVAVIFSYGLSLLILTLINSYYALFAPIVICFLLGIVLVKSGLEKTSYSD